MCRLACEFRDANFIADLTCACSVACIVVCRKYGMNLDMSTAALLERMQFE